MTYLHNFTTMLKTMLKSVPRLTRNCKRRYCCNPGMQCPELSKVILSNGVMIATENVKSPLTCMSLLVAVGPRYETACTNGLTHFIEHMAFKGFRTINKAELEELLISLSAKLDVRTSREMQVFSVMLPSENATHAVDILYKIVTELNLNNLEMKQERSNISREMKDADLDPKQVMFDYLHATAFQGTPLAQSVIGTSENIARFNPEITANFMCEHYRPHRFILATSGIHVKKIMQSVQTTFGCLTEEPMCEPDLGPNRFSGSQVSYRDDSMPFCHAAIALEAPGAFTPQYYAMLALKYIVGSWDRSQGRGEMNAPSVARGVAIGNSCERYETFYIAYRDIGLWGVYFVADKWKLDEVVFHIQDQWMHLCTTVRDTDLERGLNLFRLELARQYGSVVRSSHDIARQMLYTCGRKSLDDVNEILDNIKVDNIRELAYQCLYDKCPAVATVGPSEAMPDYLRIRSGQWWLRL